MDRSRVSQAVECFNGGFNCAQAVLSAYCKAFGLGRESALKLSCGLGAGMGRLDHVCGAVSGGYLLLGLKCGQALPDDKGAKEETYALVREFARRFAERNHSTICKELLGVDLQSGDRAIAAGRVQSICPKMVRDAAEIIEELIF